MQSDAQSQPEILTGKSSNYSFEEALKDALSQARTDLPTDHYKYTVTDISFERGGFLLVNDLIVTIKRIVPG